MSVAKVIEITSSSPRSFEDAVKQGVTRAGTTIDNITGAWVSEEKVVVTDGEISEWRVVMRVTFLLEGE